MGCGSATNGMALFGALNHLANLGQVVRLGQSRLQQKEQVVLSQIGYQLDLQALRIDLLSAARETMQATYDSYHSRLDTLLLLNALIMPFAFNTLQFSDQFLLRSAEQCPHCLEVRHSWLTTLWVYLVGVDLVMPFWSLLLLLHCKMQLESWLQLSLNELQAARRTILGAISVTCTSPSAAATPQGPCTQSGSVNVAEHEEAIAIMRNFMVSCQELFNEQWGTRCSPLVWWATLLLWCSIVASLVLISLMVWLYMERNNGAVHENHIQFAFIIGLGLVVPPAWFAHRRLWQQQSQCRDATEPSDATSAFAFAPHAAEFGGVHLS